MNIFQNMFKLFKRTPRTTAAANKYIRSNTPRFNNAFVQSEGLKMSSYQAPLDSRNMRFFYPGYGKQVNTRVSSQYAIVPHINQMKNTKTSHMQDVLENIPASNRKNIRFSYGLLTGASLVGAGSFLINSNLSLRNVDPHHYVSKYTTGPDNWSKSSHINRMGTEGLSQALFNTRHGNSKQYRGF